MFPEFLVGEADSVAGVGREPHAIDRDRHGEQTERGQEYEREQVSFHVNLSFTRI